MTQRLTSRVTLALAALPLIALAGFAWRRRWVTDDAFINFRVVDHILEGNGPVFNEGERVEVYTSAVWLAVLAFLRGVLGLPLEWTSVVLGITLAVAGVAMGSRGALVLARSEGLTGIGVPLGVVVLVALRPMWDFASSGLETGLGFAWLGGTFWALAAAYAAGCHDAVGGAAGRRSPPAWTLAFLAGLGPLIRPDFALFAVGFLVMLFAACRVRHRRRAAGLLAIAAALPVAYQVFRMGYFAAVVPNTAIAKEAGSSHWSRGWDYLVDFVTPYELWLPVLLIGALVAGRVASAWRRDERRGAVMFAVPALCGLTHALYVVRVGGDFMHARLLLPGLFGLLLPAMLVPIGYVRRPAFAVAAAAILVWSLVCVAALKLSHENPLKVRQVQDERAFYVAFTKNAHPVTLEDYRGSLFELVGTQFGELLERDERILASNSVKQYVLREPVYPDLPLSPDVPSRAAAGTFAVGIAGYTAGPDVRVIDRFGLGDPLASRMEPRPMVTFTGVVWPTRYRAGHEKALPLDWVAARFADFETPAARELGDRPGVSRARRALGCGDLRRVLHNVSTPMSTGQFFSNVADAVRTRDLKVPPEPAAAARRLCED